jgi:Cu+-exporting ATPase
VIPTQKYEVIKKLQQKGKVMFVGDGINDAPSIKQADIGIALNSGSDISKDAGDVILINNDLQSIIKSINLSTQSMKIVKQNLFWAFAYNSLGIPIAAGVLFPFFGVMLTPMYAGIAMSFSSVTVVLNSLRLKIKEI